MPLDRKNHHKNGLKYQDQAEWQHKPGLHRSCIFHGHQPYSARLQAGFPVSSYHCLKISSVSYWAAASLPETRPDREVPEPAPYLRSHFPASSCRLLVLRHMVVKGFCGVQAILVTCGIAVFSTAGIFGLSSSPYSFRQASICSISLELFFTGR